MDYNFEIKFKHLMDWTDICVLRFQCNNPKIIDELFELYGNKGVVIFLKNFLSIFPEDSEITNKLLQSIPDFNTDELRDKITDLLKENSFLKEAKQHLESRASELSESRVYKELCNLRYENTELKRKLLEEKNRSNQYYESSNLYSNLRSRWSQLFPQFAKLDELANHIASIYNYFKL